MKIRTGGPGDAASVLALLDAAVAWLVERGRTGQWGTEPWSARPAAVAHVDRYTREFLTRIAEVDGRPAGVCVLAEEPQEYAPPVDEPELYIRLLVTDRALSGSGVGAALVEDARAEARRRGVRLLRVDCYRRGEDRALVRQYEALGFTATAQFTVERPGREPWPGQVLEQRLS
jgi:GNAT superfamily N-acetyltransferase